jgi:hypothetical protein
MLKLQAKRSEKTMNALQYRMIQDNSTTQAQRTRAASLAAIEADWERRQKIARFAELASRVTIVESGSTDQTGMDLVHTQSTDVLYVNSVRIDCYA